MRAVFLSAALILVGFGGTGAADDVDRITVTASGTASVKPDVAEVHASVSGGAAMAADALRKFHDNRRRAIEAIKKLKLETLTVEEGGISMSSAAQNANRMAIMLGGNQNAAPPGHVTVTEKLVLRLSSIDRMKDGEPARVVTTVIDAAKDAGLTFGGAGLQTELVRFRSTKLEDTRQTAVKNAMQSARRKAATLAALSNATMGRILSTREIAAPVAANNNAGMSNVFMTMALAEMGMSGGGDGDEASSAEFKPISVSVTIEAQFASHGGH